MKKWLAFSLLVSLCFFSSTFAAISRPPQFVVMSFDNCTEIERWRQLADFLDRMERQDKTIHFSFFVSGTNFLSDDHQHRYQGPKHASGEAEIPFGGTKATIKERIALMNKLYLKGNEIGSHAVGHFDGSKWKSADWQKEFRAYQDLFDHMGVNNLLSPQATFAFPESDIAGFRAPYLAVNADLYKILKSNHFRYDASSIGYPTDWPTKQAGLWQFNLVRLKIAGTDKKTISMDYNFYLAQSHAKEDPDAAHQILYRQQMLDTYMTYFLSNYHGNRAPLRIGHHFTNFQNGIYLEALLTFAERICGLPEVRCVSFKELADFMDQLSINDMDAYQRGHF